jgi:hypothetical protein
LPGPFLDGVCPKRCPALSIRLAFRTPAPAATLCQRDRVAEFSPHFALAVLAHACVVLRLALSCIFRLRIGLS